MLGFGKQRSVKLKARIYEMYLHGMPPLEYMAANAEGDLWDSAN